MASINWNGGQKITLHEGDTATADGVLQQGQLYGIFLYNSSGADHNINVSIVWSNSHPPAVVTVPGTTADQGLASIVLVSGNDTNTVSASITNTPNSSIDCWLGSVGMPTDTTGLHNERLPADGQEHPFASYSRYYAVPPSSWQQLTIASNITQFISVQFQGSKATIFIVNPTSNPGQRVTALGTVKLGTDYSIEQGKNPPQFITYSFQGDGAQWVWMDADSSQNSQNATIKWQSLSGFA